MVDSKKANKHITTCGVKGCARTFDEFDKHLEQGVWTSGYVKSGIWYCSIAHFNKSKRIDGLHTFIGIVCVILIGLSLVWLIPPIFDHSYFSIEGDRLGFYFSLVILPLSIACLYFMD